MHLLVLAIILAICHTEVWSSRTEQGFAGVSDQNIVLPCFDEGSQAISGSIFWIINGSVYGPLHIPREFIVCRVNCHLRNLLIPVIHQDMDSYTFQCVSINYRTNTLYLGSIKTLEVLSLPQGLNATILNDTVKRDVLELSYPQFSVGPVNTSIGWTYSSLTCHPSLFTIQGYADRDAIPDQLDTPTLNLTSTSSVLTFPTNITNGSLYWRLLAHEESGTPCAQDSAVRYYHLDTNDTPIRISPTSDGVGCVPIPVGPRRDYSSLEVVWPERHNTHNTVGRLCYCPPFEGEQHLFSRCISTTSCDTDYSITVNNGSICFAELSSPITSIPVYFTLLESCADSSCIIRYIETYFVLEYPNASPSAEETTTKANIMEMTEHLNQGITTFQLYLHGDLSCTEWSNTDQLVKFQQIAMELAVFVQQRCGCLFPSSSITTPQFTCRSPHVQHVTYRASVGVSTVTLARQELVAALEEWPRAHRSLLIQGERLSVDDTCPVIIHALEEEECEVPTQPVIVTLSIFLVSVITAMVGSITMAVTIQFLCNFWRNKRKSKNTEANPSPSPPTPLLRTSPQTSPHMSPANLRAHEYEDIQELQATRTTNPFSNSPSGVAADYTFTECPAYVASSQV